MFGIIYKITDNTNGNVYYGSAEMTLEKRMSIHKSGVNYEYTCASSKIIKNGDYEASVLEEGEYENRFQLRERERWYIENNECVNKVIPNRTKKEYQQDNKEQIKVKRKERYEKNKDRENEMNKKYCEKHKEEIKERNKEYGKIRYEKNKEQIAEKTKEYYNNNQDKIKKYRESIKDKTKEYMKEYGKIRYQREKEKHREKITCDCGSIICIGALSRHKKSKRHLDFIENKI